MVLPNKQAHSTCDHDYTHLIKFVHWGRLLFLSQSSRCGYYSGCSFYSNKYSIRHSGGCAQLAPPASGHTAHTYMYVYHYLDDFIIHVVDPPLSPQCAHSLAILDRECNILSGNQRVHVTCLHTHQRPIFGLKSRNYQNISIVQLHQLSWETVPLC